MTTLRLGAPEDAQKITDIINKAFGPAECFFIAGDRITLDEVNRLLSVGYFVVALDGHDMIGCVYVEPRGERSYLGLLSVDPGLQQAGLGSKLLLYAEEHCTSLGCKFMDMRVVNLRTELPGYYGRRGYEETGTEPFPPDIPTKLPCWFIVMSKPLVR